MAVPNLAPRSLAGHILISMCLVQIDEFIKTGTLAALHEAQASAEGGDAPQKEQAVEGKAKDMAAKFL